ncbi:MAG: Asp23/Gls24 family envelope stress response protein [Oscillospiraceae bacterium]|nr:Asp23/Gls24 family envelope stress response protein [Oscillospiraceae bacterium]
MSDNREYLVYPDKKGTINISEEVVASIAASAASEVEGVAGLAAYRDKEPSELSGKKSLTKGVKVDIGENRLVVELFILVKYGYPMNRVGAAVQEHVASVADAMAGIKIDHVNVNVCGITMDK